MLRKIESSDWFGCLPVCDFPLVQQEAGAPVGGRHHLARNRNPIPAVSIVVHDQDQCEPRQLALEGRTHVQAFLQEGLGREEERRTGGVSENSKVAFPVLSAQFKTGPNSTVRIPSFTGKPLCFYSGSLVCLKAFYMTVGLQTGKENVKEPEAKKEG